MSSRSAMGPSTLGVGTAVSAILAALGFFCAVAGAQTPFDSSDWTWEAEIVARDAPSGFVRLPVTPEVADGSRPLVTDLRIVDQSGVLVPHVVSTPRKQPAKRWTSVRLINRTFRGGEFVRATLDFGGRDLKNHVRVTLSGDNYRRFAFLEGSEDGASWSTVDSAWLFHFRDGDLIYDARVLRFPANDFPYLRLTAYNMEDEPGTIDMLKVETSHHVVAEGPAPVPLDIRVLRVESEDEEENVTLLDIDTRFRHLPLRALSVDPTTPYFYRRYELLGRDALTEAYERRTESGPEPAVRDVPWSTVQCGVFYRIERDDDVDEDLTIDKVGRSFRYLRLRIVNGDDAPLDIALQDIEVTRDALSSLVFDHRPGERYRLFWGNSKAAAPRYDLGRSVESIDRSDLPKVEIGAVTRLIEEIDAESFLQRYTWLLWAVLGLAVVIMSAIILRNLRNVSPE